MFQFSKVMDPGSRRTPKTPEQYFANWIAWFTSRMILTEIRLIRKGASLWRDGTEATEKNLREENRRGGKK